MPIWLQSELAALESAGLLRRPRAPLPPGTVVLCSNDYLGYAAEPLAPGAAPGGAGASRLISGDDPEHRALEEALCRWLVVDAAIVFSSGYAANAGTLAALCGEGDLVASDALNHASIIDGCRLGRARVAVYPHGDLAAAEQVLAQPARRRFLVSESYFSMDGDSPDLAGLRRLCDRHDAALIVDEAHALGVFGPAGRGLCAAAGIRPDVLIGTLGKALGLQGAFVAGSGELALWLWNRARSFVFSTGLSPALCAAARERITRCAGDDDARRRLARHADRLRAAVAATGAPLGASHGPIVPWICGAPEAALARSARLLGRGVFAPAIRPPTVPEGTARLRLTASAGLDEAALDRAVLAIGAA